MATIRLFEKLLCLLGILLFLALSWSYSTVGVRLVGGAYPPVPNPFSSRPDKTSRLVNGFQSREMLERMMINHL